MNNRRIKSFEERMQELVGSIDIISDSIRKLEQTNNISWLRIVASQLRALIVYKENSSSFKHPLLFELAKENGFPLTVYVSDQDYLNKIKSMFGDSLIFYSTGDPFSLEQDMIYTTPQSLEDAMETLSVEMLGKQLSVKEVLTDVANTEASHYDPTTPATLDNMKFVELGGLPSHYRIVFALGKVVCDLGYRFLQTIS